MYLVLEDSLQKSAGDFCMPVSDHICAKRLVICGNMSCHCDVFQATDCGRHEDFCLLIAECLDHAPSLPEFTPNDNRPLVAPWALVGMVMLPAARVHLRGGVRAFDD